jgi:hypothetical protein
MRGLRPLRCPASECRGAFGASLPFVADEHGSVEDQLKEIGAQLDWVRDYL